MNTSKPKPKYIVTNWRRFSMGLWRVPRGDIAEAYSASSFPKATVFKHEGCLYTNGGTSYSKTIHSEADGYPLIPAAEYHGADSVPYSYAGREVTCKGKLFRLGTKIIFAASDPTVEEWHRLLRAMFADGGYFAAGCDYPEFLASRLKLDSVNSRAASLKELADCENGLLPKTKDAMREWLDTGAKALRSPNHQLVLFSEQ